MGPPPSREVSLLFPQSLHVLYYAPSTVYTLFTIRDRSSTLFNLSLDDSALSFSLHYTRSFERRFSALITITIKMFSKTFILSALAAVVAADNSALFVNQDATTRHVVFTPSEGFAQIDEIAIAGNTNATQAFPQGWTGNAYSYNDGEQNVAGILAEFAFNGYGDANFFDISAIVNPQATDGIIMMYPSNSKTPVSGCVTVSCTNQYNLPDDIATLASPESDFTVILGSRIQSARRGINDAVARKYVLA